MEDYNKYLEHQIEVLEQQIENQKEIIKKQSEKIIPENHELHNRISRAIEYIEEHKRNVYDTFGEGIVFGEMGGIKEILNILRGEE